LTFKTSSNRIENPMQISQSIIIQPESPCNREDRAPDMVIGGSGFLLEDCQMPKTHGLSRESGKNRKLYKVWSQMKNRCKNPNSEKYKYYGAMGVKVCDQWFDFLLFYNWAMRAGYRHGLQIDRKDPDGNYEPDNCRWVTPFMQMLNRRPKKGRGVNWDKRRNNWRARVNFKGKEIYNRSFKDYDKAVLFVEKEKSKIYDQHYKKEVTK